MDHSFNAKFKEASLLWIVDDHKQETLLKTPAEESLQSFENSSIICVLGYANNERMFTNRQNQKPDMQLFHLLNIRKNKDYNMYTA